MKRTGANKNRKFSLASNGALISNMGKEGQGSGCRRLLKQAFFEGKQIGFNSRMVLPTGGMFPWFLLGGLSSGA